MFCLTMNPEHYKIIKKINYIPVGLGNKKFKEKNWKTDKTKKNIAKKNKFYGEYTFHYWLWKNYKFNSNRWIGFCQYRKFWKKKKLTKKINNFVSFNNTLLKKIPNRFVKYDVILGEELYVNKFKFSKFIKKNLKKMILKPKYFFNKKKRNIKFHFDMMHGDGNLEKAISVLDLKEKIDFTKFVNTEVSFNPHNMFIVKNNEILKRYYNSLFPWLKRCEKIFGFKNLKGYGLQRIYGFLAERYMSYWFKKYTKVCIIPILFKDISDFSYKNL